MKVLLVNGSPHKSGCTNRALEEVAATLQKEGLETETGQRRRLRVRHTGSLRRSQRQYDGIHGPSVLFRTGWKPE